MDTTLAARLSQGIKKLQGLVGETCTITGITFPCIIGSESMQETLTDGGWETLATVAISINLADILASPVVPALGAPVLLQSRNRTYRLSTINPTQTTWELSLIDLST